MTMTGRFSAYAPAHNAVAGWQALRKGLLDRGGLRRTGGNGRLLVGLQRGSSGQQQQRLKAAGLALAQATALACNGVDDREAADSESHDCAADALHPCVAISGVACNKRTECEAAVARKPMPALLPSGCAGSWPGPRREQPPPCRCRCRRGAPALSSLQHHIPRRPVPFSSSSSSCEAAPGAQSQSVVAGCHLCSCVGSSGQTPPAARQCLGCSPAP
jgi:hypothetical protein